MGLQNIVLASEDVKTTGGSFAVSGLSSYAIGALMQAHREDLSALYGDAVAKVKRGEAVTYDESFITTFPKIVAQIIALGSGSDPAGTDWLKDVAIASQLPVGAQMDAIEKISRLTFTSDMPIKKFVALLLQGMTVQSGMFPKP